MTGPGTADTPTAGAGGVPPRVVALGGGHGLAVSLQALRGVTPHLTAVVTVADDGGSSGRLRDELGVLPVGDLRMALAALAGDDAWGRSWERLLQHRFGGDGPLAGHAVGNLLLAALADTEGGVVPALDLVGQLLGGPGRVLPACSVPLDILAQVAGLVPTDPAALTEVRGQVAVATTPGQVVQLQLDPSEPPGCPEAVDAVRAADWVVLGPGSWFTSVLTHLFVPELRAALEDTSARLLVTLNLAPQAGETEGFSPEEHLEVLLAHAPGLSLDVVLTDAAAVTDRRSLTGATEALGARLVLAPVARGDGTARHHPVRLRAAYDSIFSGAAWR